MFGGYKLSSSFWGEKEDHLRVCLVDYNIDMQGTQDYKLKSLVEAIKRDDHNEIYEFSKELLK